MNYDSKSRFRRTATRAGLVAAALLVGATCAAGPDALPAPDGGVTHLAQARREMRAMRHRGPRDYANLKWLLAAADELNLSDSQQEKLRAIRRSAPGILMPKRQAVEEARLDLADLMARKDASAAELRSAHERLVQARGAISTAMFDLRMQAREVLTEQQRQKLREGVKAGPRPFRQGLRMPPPDDGSFPPDAFDGFDFEPGMPGDEFEADI